MEFGGKQAGDYTYTEDSKLPSGKVYRQKLYLETDGSLQEGRPEVVDRPATTVTTEPEERSTGDETPPPTPTIGKQRSASNKNNKFSTPLRYPYAMLAEETDYLQIEILKYKTLGITPQANVLQEGVRSSKKFYDNVKKIDAIGTILLPIPQNISSTNSTGWGEDSLNTIAAYGLGAAGDIIESPNFLNGIINAALQAGGDIEGLAVSGQAQNLSSSFFASKAVNILGANTSFSGVLARSTGQILNPNTELLFNGVKLRSFNFSFNLAPRNAREAKEIKKIIIELKRNMAPASTIAENSENAGLFLKSPNVFRLKYRTGNSDHKFLNSFVVAALTNVQVNYTGSGTYMTYSDKSKTPVHMVMQLSFQELSPIYAEDYDDFGNEEEGYKQGVGY
tara:strand:+ start:54 stop:1232 length:1179 start_codon:yes stop_codon:yes gene_type:complete